ncbi:hypothetical protein RB595_000746 [Gaeumannomyces hyphopodioides]
MSIELNWETLTQGPDGDELKNRIRDFIHAKFQTVPLPRFIKSVTVHDFQFGSIPPELELKDITDPLPDFYEEDPDADYDDDDDDDDDDEGGGGAGKEEVATVHSGPEPGGPPSGPGSSPEDHRAGHAQSSPLRPSGGSSLDPGRWPRSGPGARQPGGGGGININTRLRGEAPAQDLTSPFLGTSTPGILSGGTSNFSYFHSHLASSGLSGTQTPLAAVAGAHRVHPPWLDVHGFRGGGNGRGGGQQQHQQQRDDSSSSRGSSRHKPAGSPVLEVDGFTPSHSRHSSVSATPDPATQEPARRGSPLGIAGSGLAPLLQPRLREKHSVSTLAPTSVGNNSRPPTREKPVAKSEDDVDDHNEGGAGAKGAAGGATTTAAAAAAAAGGNTDPTDQHREDGRRFREQRIEDLQAVFRIRYAGDVKLLLTADILLDYPMPSFVGIPVRLSITGLTFDGVGVLAYIRKRVHFCFLSPEDAVAITGSGETEVGDEAGAEAGGGDRAEGQPQPQQQQQQQSPPPPSREGRSRVTSSASTVGGESTTRMGGLLQEIRVESEIGQRESGKQSLRNVGKVERFVLEQVRRIFEEEFVYPSFWTFLV